MSLVALGMDLILVILLGCALTLGVKLNRRLKALKQSYEGFAHAIIALDDAAIRAEKGLADLREMTTEAHDSLLERIETAKNLSRRLELHIQTTHDLIGDSRSQGETAQETLMASHTVSHTQKEQKTPEGFMSPVLQRLTEKFGLDRKEKPSQPLFPKKESRHDINIKSQKDIPQRMFQPMSKKQFLSSEDDTDEVKLKDHAPTRSFDHQIKALRRMV